MKGILSSNGTKDIRNGTTTFFTGLVDVYVFFVSIVSIFDTFAGSFNFTLLFILSLAIQFMLVAADFVFADTESLGKIWYVLVE